MPHSGETAGYPITRKGLREGQLPPPGAGEKVQNLRQRLERLHHEAKSKDGVGGGVSLWPAMDDMRLSREDVWRLAAVCVSLLAVTMVMFNFYHGVCCCACLKTMLKSLW